MKKRYFVFNSLLFLLIVASDQLSKYWAVATLKGAEGIALLPGVLQLTYVENSGAAFGIFQNQRMFFLIITILIFLAFGIYIRWRRPESRLFWLSLSLIMGGAVGNLIDRIRLSYVVDMIDFRLINFPVFNIADTFVVIGTIFLCAYILFYEQQEKM
jgi:signal peptidase II